MRIEIMLLPDNAQIAERHADLRRQAKQQHLVRLAQSEEKSTRLDWRQIISPVINWLQQQRAPKPVASHECNGVLCS
jgi:hypothetical protein